MLEKLIEIDQSLFLKLNEIHHPFFDTVMWWVSDMAIWFPFYGLMLFLILRKETINFKSFDWKYIVFLVVSIAITITIADQVASGFCKPFFERFRPSHEPLLDGLVHLHQYDDGNFYKGGKFGFVSSHAANSFAIAVLLLQFFKPSKFRYFILLWAAVVAYSRIYLGVHYPGDILGGMLVGIIAGIIGFKAYSYFKRKFILPSLS